MKISKKKIILETEQGSIKRFFRFPKTNMNEIEIGMLVINHFIKEIDKQEENIKTSNYSPKDTSWNTKKYYNFILQKYQYLDIDSLEIGDEQYEKVGLSKIFVPQTATIKEKSRDLVINSEKSYLITDIVNDKNRSRLVILGEPGAGKS